MAETANIAKMAEKLSQDLFNVLGWQKTAPMNTNFACLDKQKHGVETHPTDAVWYYDEPYTNTRTYILTDLKSYSKSSITPNNLQKAIVNLSKTMACAENSQEFKDRFLVDPLRSSQVTGLLFIYNHDGDYDKDFGKQMKGVSAADVRFIPQGRHLIVLGPKDVCELNTIVNHIKNLGCHGRTTEEIQTSFFFPDLKLRKHIIHEQENDAWSNAVPLPNLVSKILSVKTRKKGSSAPYDDFHIYYRGIGKSVEEFLHLIDFIFRYQQSQTATGEIKVHFVCLDSTTTSAAAFFDRAKNEYREVSGLTRGQLECLTFESVTNVVRQYSEIELGMI
jgi:hypothetical protein